MAITEQTTPNVSEHVSPPSSSQTLCCPKFDPAPWQGREFLWHEKPFVTARVHSFLHVPLDFSKKLRENNELIAAAEAGTKSDLVLSDENSLWGADIYIEVAKPVPGAHMASLSGTFVTRAFDGPFNDAPLFSAALQAELVKQGRRVEKMLFWYTTCPRCAKAYGHNYVVVFAKLQS